MAPHQFREFGDEGWFGLTRHTSCPSRSLTFMADLPLLEFQVHLCKCRALLAHFDCTTDGSCGTASVAVAGLVRFAQCCNHAKALGTSTVPVFAARRADGDDARLQRLSTQDGETAL